LLNQLPPRHEISPERNRPYPQPARRTPLVPTWRPDRSPAERADRRLLRRL